MPSKVLSALALLACLTAAALAAPAPAPKPAPKKSDEVEASGQTVILGTWTWSVVGNKLGGKGGADVFWEQVTSTQRNLVPRGGAGWALVKDRAFEKVGLEDLRKASYETGKLPGTDLRPGTVVALRTHDGWLAKLYVVGYRESHDSSFPEAALLPPGWVQFARGRPNIKEYHLEVRWVLYKGK